MNQPNPIEKPKESDISPNNLRRHPLTLENSPEETIKRMRSLPERISKFKEFIQEQREANRR